MRVREVTAEEFETEVNASEAKLLQWLKDLGPEPVSFWKLRIVTGLDPQMFICACCVATRKGLQLIPVPPYSKDRNLIRGAITVRGKLYGSAAVGPVS